MKIYLLRHTEAYNPDNIDYYQTDLELSEKGKKQAKELVKKLKKYHYDVIFSSPMKRARQTIAPFLKTLENPKVVYESLIIERHTGEFNGKYPKRFFLNYCLKNNLDRISFRPKDGESLLDVTKRAKEFFKFIEKNYKDKSVLVVSHGNVLRCLEGLIKKIDPADFYQKLTLFGLGELKKYVS
ncbi:histidine phosphatase family protein [bacterium]|nr:MAG: histidine phosphatase family protein [bacterium]